jgi:hypothetical protein
MDMKNRRWLVDKVSSTAPEILRSPRAALHGREFSMATQHEDRLVGLTTTLLNSLRG